jgi:hypothetical protein
LDRLFALRNEALETAITDNNAGQRHMMITAKIALAQSSNEKGIQHCNLRCARSISLPDNSPCLAWSATSAEVLFGATKLISPASTFSIEIKCWSFPSRALAAAPSEVCEANSVF